MTAASPQFIPEGLIPLETTGDGLFRAGEGGVQSVGATGDRKVEIVNFGKRALARVGSSMGYPAYYPLLPVAIEGPVEAVLMDLDGTTVRSEHFWIWIIEKTIASLREAPAFKLEDEDLPHVSGHSVSEHLQYGIAKYCPGKTVEEAREWYFEHTNHEMAEIMAGRGKEDAFTPAPGAKEFLLELKRLNVKIGLVTSGLYEKGWPEILSAFKTMDLGDPQQFYDAIVTAGFAIRQGEPGTLGELQAKPHPWLYAEAARVGLGVDFENRHRVIGIEDSGAGVCSVRLAGFSCIGMTGGNIEESGTQGFCARIAPDFEAALELIA